MYHIKQRDDSLQNFTMLSTLKYIRLVSTSSVTMHGTTTLNKLLTNQLATDLLLWFRTCTYKFHSVFASGVIIFGTVLGKITQELNKNKNNEPGDNHE